MNQKLIIPAEIKICATCSYWDGERKIDPKLGLVIVSDDSEGDCLPQSKKCRAINNEFHWQEDCLWEHLAPDEKEMTSDGK